jgi:hypothetical protein
MGSTDERIYNIGRPYFKTIRTFNYKLEGMILKKYRILLPK